MSGLVSVIMPSYNTGRFIAESIRSVMAQTYSDWELIIVDDCSTDDTMNVIQSVISAVPSSVVLRSEAKDFASRIRVLQNATNSGAAVSRNRALREARGKYIAFLDSDDLWAPDKLEKQIRFMEENGYDFTYTKYSEIDEDGSALGVTVGGPAHIGKTGMYNYCWPGCLTVMYNREVVGDIQIADIKKNNDYAMWLKIIRKAKCHLLPEVLASYRKRRGSISNHSYMALIKWHYKLYREAEGMNPVSSLWITVRNLFFGVMKKFLYVGRS
ncbi:MAG: glycosyltransferase [Fibrobacter sp.]|nr:glycosyltransferase [Fibrobacter sp.]